MSCPYFEEGYIGACGASVAKYVPTIERMETFCFKPAYQLCPTLREYLRENEIAMSHCSAGNVLSRC